MLNLRGASESDIAKTIVSVSTYAAKSHAIVVLQVTIRRAGRDEGSILSVTIAPTSQIIKREMPLFTILTPSIVKITADREEKIKFNDALRIL